MKIKFLSLFAAIALGAAYGTWAQTSQITVNVDENGNAYVVTPAGGATPITFALTNDTTGPGGLPGALTYTLGFNPTPGDVVLAEPGSSQPSDVLRFNNGPVNGFLVVYSDVSANDPKDAKADIGMPTAFYPNPLHLVETGPEVGPNGLFGYTPTAGQPGFVPGTTVTYNFTSDLPSHVGVNKDFVNTTGAAVNDFEWLVQGSFASVLFHYDGPFTSFTITPQGTNTLFTWSGATIPNGGTAHVGVTLPSPAFITLGTFWTLNGTKVACVHQVPIGQGGSHIITGQPGQIAFDNVCLTCESTTLYVGNVHLEWFTDEVPLSQLNGTSQRSPIRVDTISGSPMPIAPNGEAVVQTLAPPNGATFVMVQYNVNSDPGLPSTTNTTDFAEYEIAAPGSVPVFGAAGLISLILLVAGSGIFFIRTRAGKKARSTG